MSRVGIGFDAHPFDQEREKPLRLGGLEFADQRGLKGHSDGDALLHAIADAILGAAGAGSIGERFPDDDPTWKGADSSGFLIRASEIAAERGLRVGNVDAVVIAEDPKIAPRATEIASRIAALLSVAPDVVSVRGTSTNRLGFPGRREGIAAMAVVLLVAKSEKL